MPLTLAQMHALIADGGANTERRRRRRTCVGLVFAVMDDGTGRAR